MTRVPVRLVVTVLLAGGIVRASGSLAAAITTAEAAKTIGKRVLVCGDVGAVHAPQPGRPGPLTFELGVAGKPADLLVTIEAGALKRFSPLFDHHLVSRQVCVDGTPQAAKTGPATMAVKNLEDFEFFGSPPGRPADFAQGAVELQLHDEVVKPNVLTRTPPKYTDPAMRQRITGDVEIEGVLGTNGRLGRVRVVRSLDPLFGLDDQAISSVLQWTFEPARSNGQSVPSIVSLVVTFQITSAGPYPYPALRQTAEPTITPLIDAAPGSPIPNATGQFGAGVVKTGDLGVTSPKILTSVAPHYPLDALRKDVEGQVLVDVIVGADGKPREMRVARSLAGNAGGVDDEAMRAVSRWSFVPGKMGDKPVATWARVGVDFRMQK